MMSSDFTSLPRVTSEAGLPGYYLSPLSGGVWQHQYPGKELFSSLLKGPDESVQLSKIKVPTLQEWTVEISND